MYYALCVHECVLVALGTIPILRQHIFGLFLTHSIVSINTALNVSIFPNQPFTSPLICWRNGSSTEFRLTSFDRVLPKPEDFISADAHCHLFIAFNNGVVVVWYRHNLSWLRIIAALGKDCEVRHLMVHSSFLVQVLGALEPRGQLALLLLKRQNQFKFLLARWFFFWLNVQIRN